MVQSRWGDDERTGIPVEVEVSDSEFHERADEIVLGGDERFLRLEQVTRGRIAAQLELFDGFDAASGDGDRAILDLVGLTGRRERPQVVADLDLDPVGNRLV